MNQNNKIFKIDIFIKIAIFNPDKNFIEIANILKMANSSRRQIYQNGKFIKKWQNFGFNLKRKKNKTLLKTFAEKPFFYSVPGVQNKTFHSRNLQW